MQTKTNSQKLLLVGHCNICNDKIFTNSSFVVLANKKRYCFDCYEELNNPVLKSSPNSV
jgi:hypothetical protein